MVDAWVGFIGAGAGHGVGAGLSVHEGPVRISRVSDIPLEPGMILSNEPGYYREGHWGIRIETLQVVTPAVVPEGGERPMHGFEQLTFAPIDRKLIAVEMLTPDERAYVDAYHAETMAKVGPLVDGAAGEWLKAACAPL